MHKFTQNSLLAIMLCGCTSVVPSLPQDQDLPVALIVKSVQCEMQDAVQRFTTGKTHQWLMDWEAAYVLTINISEIVVARAGAGVPLLTRDVLTGFGVGVGTTATNKRIAKLTFTPMIRDVLKYDCTGFSKTSLHPFVNGKIGFAEWLNRAVLGIEPGQIQDSQTPYGSTPVSIGHTFEFSVDYGGNLTPVITILPVGGATVTPSLAVNRTDGNTLEVTFAAPKNAVVKTQTTTTTPVVVPLAPTKAEMAEREIKKLEIVQQAEKIASANLKLFSLPGDPVLKKFEEELQRKTIGDAESAIRSAEKRIAEIDRPKTEIRRMRSTMQTVTTQVVPSNPSAQEALLQLQLERLLSGPRNF